MVQYHIQNLLCLLVTNLDQQHCTFHQPYLNFCLLNYSIDLLFFYMIENEWQDLKTRNIALSAVIYDEFIKELAAICQEHSVLTN